MASGEAGRTQPEAVLDRISDGVLALDNDLVYTYANERAVSLLELDREDIVGTYIWDLFPEAEDSIAGERIEEARASGRETSYERYREVSDQWFAVDVYPDADGLTIVFREITERKEREQELERYERIVENLPVAVGENAAGEQEGFTSANAAAVEMFDAESKAELEERSLGEQYVDESERKAVRDQLRETGRIEGREVKLETLAGEEFWASMTATVQQRDGETSFVGIIEDVTDRKERERRLKRLYEATQALVSADTTEEVTERVCTAARRLFETATNGVYLFDEEDGLVPASVTDATGESVEEPPSPDDGPGRRAFRAGEVRAIDGTDGSDGVFGDEIEAGSELLVPLGDHGILVLASTAADRFDDDDIHAAKLLASAAETALTERAKAQQLRERDQELQQAEVLFQNAQDAFFVVDVDAEGGYHMQRVNPAYESLTGLTSEEMHGRTLDGIFGADDGRAIRQRYDECVAERAPITYVEQLDIPEPGSYWETRLAPVVVEDEVVQLVGATRNVTEQETHQRRLEEQRDGLELLNEMVRHDIRNDLQVIASYAELLATRVDEDDREYVARILNNAENAVELTRSARDLAGTMLQTDESTEPTPLKRTLLSQIDDVRTSYADAVVSVDGTIPTVTVEADDMLSSVFRNVVKNAIQHNDKAVPEVTVSVATGDDAVRVAVLDNGPGIPDEQKEKVFGKGEKGLGSEGTGIGLYLVNTLVERYGGSVRVDDNEPEGTIVTVTLPRA